MQKKALLNILAALLIFSTNGIWSGFTSLTSAQIVFVRLLIGVLCTNGHAAGVGKSGGGIVLAILSAVLYAAMIMTNKKVEHTDGLEKTVVQMSCAFVISVLYFIVRGMPILFPIAKEDIIFVLILGESIGPLQLVGAACILGGAMFVELSGRMGKAAPVVAEAAPAEQPPQDA